VVPDAADLRLVPPGAADIHADWIIELGPGAGHDGAGIVFEGTPTDLVAARSTRTGEHPAAHVGP
jgi:excinuclease UvrABC ATPase subunit